MSQGRSARITDSRQSSRSCSSSAIDRPAAWSSQPLSIAATSSGVNSGASRWGPRQLQRRSELAEHVAHAALAAGQMERQVCAHGGPAQARPVRDGVVQLGRGGHAVVHQVQHLSPQRLLQAVRQVALDLVAHHQRVHDQILVVGDRGVHDCGASGVAGHHLHERQQVHRVERVADDDALAVAAAFGEA